MGAWGARGADRRRDPGGGSFTVRRKSPRTVVLADDEHLVRAALRCLLEARLGLRVVGEAADGLDTLRLVRRVRPALVLVDIVMPGLDGLEVTRRIRQRPGDTRVIVVSRYTNEAFALQAYRNGASAYVAKCATVDDLEKAITAARTGGWYASPALPAPGAASRDRPRAPDDFYERLTSREHEVFHLAAEGLSSARIARRLLISPRTAETHRANAMRKLGLTSQAELIRYAVERGILPPLRFTRRRGRPRTPLG